MFLGKPPDMPSEVRDPQGKKRRPLGWRLGWTKKKLRGQREGLHKNIFEQPQRLISCFKKVPYPVVPSVARHPSLRSGRRSYRETSRLTLGATTKMLV